MRNWIIGSSVAIGIALQPLYGIVLSAGVLGLYCLTKYPPWGLMGKMARIYSNLNREAVPEPETGPGWMRLSYARGQAIYHVHVPYCRSYCSDMVSLSLQVFLDDKYHDITQQPGLAYIVSATDLGGEHIRGLNHETGASYFWYGKEKPHFCLELLEDD